MRARLKVLLAFEERHWALADRRIETRQDCLVERLRFRAGEVEAEGFLTRPAGVEGPLPAVLLAHAHGERYDIGARELVDGRPALLDAPGPVLARAGLRHALHRHALFGSRAAVAESAAAKAALWYGRTLFGQMLGELAGALSWLRARPDVDPERDRA